jgi:hypothetical protein
MKHFLGVAVRILTFIVGWSIPAVILKPARPLVAHYGLVYLRKFHLRGPLSSHCKIATSQK